MSPPVTEMSPPPVTPVSPDQIAMNKKEKKEDAKTAPLKEREEEETEKY